MKVVEVVKLIVLHICFAVLGFVLFVISFSTFLFNQIDVLFYRGIVLALLTSAFIGGIWFAVRYFFHKLKKIITTRDVLLSACVILSLNVLFFTHLPTTIDRSISIFMLGTMTQSPDHVFTEQEITDIFVKKYVEDYGAFAKRFHEQEVIGTIAASGGGGGIV